MNNNKNLKENNISEKNVILKKRSYKEMAIENKQKREIEKLKFIDKTEKYITKKKKEKILSRFENIPKEYKSRWDMEEKSDLYNKSKSSKKKSILKPILSNWDKPQNYSNSELKHEISTPLTIHSTKNTKIQQEENFLQDLTKEQLEIYQKEIEIEKRNRYITDKELDDLLPDEGFEIIKPPVGYKQMKITRNMNNNKNPFDKENEEKTYTIPELNQMGKELPAMTQNDLKYFGSLLSLEKNRKLTSKEKKERKILSLLLKIKNGTSTIRKEALKEITEQAQNFGAELLFNRIIPLLLDSSLDLYEKHLIIKVLNRIIYKLDDKIRPYLNKLLALVQPMLTEEDYFIRLEGRELISNISKAAGLSNFIMAIRNDLDNPNDSVRDITAQAFSIGANALTLPAVMPFIKAVCKSRKSWEARHTGCKIVFHIAKLMGCGILPHLKGLINCIEMCLCDDNKRVRIASALSLASLANSSKPFGIEAFDSVLKRLWDGMKIYRGREFAAFLKAMGNLIPLMDDLHSKEYTRLIVNVLLKEFSTPEDDMKKIILQVIYQSIEKGGIDPEFIRDKILEPFWENFWTRRLVLDRGASFRLIDATVSIAGKIGCSDVIKKLTFNLKEDNEMFRKITMITLQKIIEMYGVDDISLRLEEILVDAAIFAFYQQVNDEDNAVLKGFSSIIKGLGVRSKKYLPQIVANICARSKIPSNRLRQQAADLVVNLAEVIYDCEEYKLLLTLSNVLYENLGEEYPEVLGSILKGIKSIIKVIGIEKITPPISELLPSLTPILKNRHEKVQKNLVDLIGLIADHGGENIEPREWIRICVDLLDLLKAPKKKHPPFRHQHLRLHSSGHRATRRPSHSHKQPQSSRPSNESLYNNSNSCCCRNMWVFHSFTSFNE